MVTGHEVCSGARVSVSPKHQHIFDFISRNQEMFPGFFHWDLEGNVLPKLEIMQEFGFYPRAKQTTDETESCGAHSPNVPERKTDSLHSPVATATAAGK